MNDMPETYSCKRVKARVWHLCCECWGRIKKGESYHFHSGIWDCAPDSFKVCVDCEELRDELSVDLHTEDIPWFGGIHEFLLEGDYDPELCKRFAEIKMKRRWKDD